MTFMAEIILHCDKPNASTSVSNIFIDEYMSDANGEYVKIYLYLLRLMSTPGTTFSISSIADKFEHTEKDVRRALCYWEKMHLLRLEYDSGQNLTGVYLLDSLPQSIDAVSDADTSASSGVSVATAGSTAFSSSESAVVSSVLCSGTATLDSNASGLEAAEVSAASDTPSISYSANDIRQFRQNECVAELFFIAEHYLGRTLSSTDVNTLLYLYDGLGFSTDLLEYLIESCVSAGHTSIQYIQKVALNWDKAGIHTVEAARQNSRMYSKTHYAVMNALGISGRKLVPMEMEYIDKWTGAYGFSLDIIQEACKRTIASIHQPSFKYVDSILENWHNRQIHHLSDVAKLDAEHQNSRKRTVSETPSAVSGASKNKFNNFQQRSYDYDQLEKMLLTTNVH
jgi:DnaD/phage-associated family protein